MADSASPASSELQAVESLCSQLVGVRVFCAGAAARHTAQLAAAGAVMAGSPTEASVVIVRLGDPDTPPSGFPVPVIALGGDPATVCAAVLPPSSRVADQAELERLRRDALTSRDHAIGAEASVRHMRDQLSRAELRIAGLNDLIAEIYSSRTWRAGNRIVRPIYRAKQVVGR